MNVNEEYEGIESKMAAQPKRVVVTGVGVVSACGCSIDSFWNNILQGNQYFNPPDSFDPNCYKSNRTIALDKNEILKNCDASGPTETRFIGDIISKKVFADAVKSSGLAKERIRQAGICFGTTTGSPHQRNSYQSETDPEQWLINQLKSNFFTDIYSIAAKWELEGTVEIVSSACTSSLISISRAAELIKSGEAELMIAGGCDVLQELTFAGFNSLRIVSNDICRSLDVSRNGIILGEGAVAVCLEDYDKAVARKAPILCEISGVGISCDAHHVVAPSSEGAILAITKALENSNLAVTDIGYINLHGTGTKLNDKAEINAVNTVFKPVIGQIIANSTKSITGHLLGTAGSMEFLISMLALLHNTIPPAMNIVNLDPEIEFQVNCGAPVPKELKHVLTNAFGFGGNNIAMILSKI